MSDAVPQESSFDGNEGIDLSAQGERSSNLYEKLNPVIQLYSDLSEGALHSEAFLDRLLEQIRDMIQPDIMLLFTQDEETQEWVLYFQKGLPEHLLKDGKLARAWQSLPTIVSHESGVLFSEDISKDRRFIGQVIRGINIKTFSGVTLKSGDRIHGSLLIGFFEPYALSVSDQGVFMLLSNLVTPFLLPTKPQPAPPVVMKDEEDSPPSGPEPITVVLDLSSRIQSGNKGFLTLVGMDEEAIKKMPISKLFLKKGGSAFSGMMKKIKAGNTPDAEPVELTFVRAGGRKRIVRAKFHPEKEEDQIKRVVLTAEDITDIEPLETELAFKKGMQTVINTISLALRKISKETSGHAKHQIEEEAILTEAMYKGFAQFGIEGAALLKLQSGKKKISILADQGFSDQQLEQVQKHGIGAKEHLIWKTVEKSVPMILTAKSKKSHLKKRLLGEEGLISFMGIPVESDDHLWGVLIFFSRDTLFSDRELHAATTLGEEIGYGIDQIRAFGLLQKKIESLLTLNEVGQSISKSLNLEQLLSSIADNLKKMIGASNSYIFLEDAKRHLFYGACASEQRADAVRKFEIKVNENHLIPITAKERHPFVIENASHDARVGKKWMKAFKSRSLLAVPLINKDRVSGVLLLDETRYFRKFTEDEIQRVSDMAYQVSIGIENAILHNSVSRHRERLQTLSSAIVNVQEEERRRIAKKLREESAQALTTIRNDVEWLKKKMDSPTSEVKKRLDRSSRVAGATFESLKNLSAELRPPILDESGLVSTVKWVVKEFESQNEIKVHLQISGAIKRLPARIEILLFRIIQESLANIGTHAKAESAIVSLEKRDPYIHLYVTDDGKGFDVKRYFSSPQMMRKEIGILGMKERVELSGGTFYIDSHPGQGTRISIRIPVVRRGGQTSNN